MNAARPHTHKHKRHKDSYTDTGWYSLQSMAAFDSHRSDSHQSALVIGRLRLATFVLTDGALHTIESLITQLI